MTQPEPTTISVSAKMQYYRNPREHIGNSLYRDFQNRIQRHKLADFAHKMKAKLNMDKRYAAPMTDQLLTEKFERLVEQHVFSMIAHDSQEIDKK